MGDTQERKHSPDALKAALYQDSVSEKTEKVGKTLLIVAALALLTGMFNIKAKSAALFPLDFTDSPETLGVLLSVLTLFLLLNYLLRFSSDFFRARETLAEIDIEIELKRVSEALRSAQLTEESFSEHEDAMHEGYGPDPEPWWEHYYDVSTSARKNITKIENYSGDKRASKFLWMARFMFFGFSPIFVALLALSHSGPSFEKFFHALFAYS